MRQTPIAPCRYFASVIGPEPSPRRLEAGFNGTPT